MQNMLNCMYINCVYTMYFHVIGIHYLYVTLVNRVALLCFFFILVTVYCTCNITVNMLVLHFADFFHLHFTGVMWLW